MTANIDFDILDDVNNRLETEKLNTEMLVDVFGEEAVYDYIDFLKSDPELE